jgi:gamma-glutamyltranspeptidase/glutathione hydrolase
VEGQTVAARLWEELKEKGAYRGDPPDARALSVARAGFAVDAGRTVPASSAQTDPGTGPAASSFVVVDREGGSVACALTLNGRFGTGRILPGTGILAARPPRDGAAGNASLAAMLVVNAHNPNVFFAAAASGDVAAPTALVTVALRALVDQRPLEDAIGEPRLHGGNADGTVLAEAGVGAEVAAALRARGMRVVEAPRLGRVNAIHCAKGMPRAPGSCTYRADRRGNGYAATGGQ